MRVGSDYLKRTAQSPGVRAIKAQALESLNLAAGNRVLDVGCGPAIDTVAIAQIVGPLGLVLGVDKDPAMVAEANRIAVGAGVGAVARHVVGDAAALAAGPDGFDACFCERVLQHLRFDEVGRAAREIVRVVRRGARIAVVDTDWATLSIASTDPWLERRVVREHALQFASPFAGRMLLPLFGGMGLADIAVETFSLLLGFEAVDHLLAPVVNGSVASGRISAVEAQRWSAEGRLANEYGTFFAHVNMVLLTGSKA